MHSVRITAATEMCSEHLTRSGHQRLLGSHCTFQMQLALRGVPRFEKVAVKMKAGQGMIGTQDENLSQQRLSRQAAL